MPRIEYTPKRFSPERLAVIEQADAIAREWRGQGFDLTLRQLYYQFVSADLIANKQSEYKRLGDIINDARYAGLFDWDFITDRTRNVQGGFGGYDSPADVIDEDAYIKALWEGQPERVEVWVEKDALSQVVQRGRAATRVPYFSCRGYTSSSEVWAASQRIEGYLDEPGVEAVTIIHLGDHDPSGIDMTRDITDRLELFLGGDGYDPGLLTIERIALNMDQVRTYTPPPNPAKQTDSRYAGYIRRFGDESWELDALRPDLLVTLIGDEVLRHVDVEMFNARVELEREGRRTLRVVRDNYDRVIEQLREEGLL